jgi:hypothetical protein
MAPQSVAIRRTREEPPKKKKPESRFTNFPWKLLLAAAAPLILLACYLTMVAPDLVPIPEGVKVPFPALTDLLEQVCAWSGKNAGTVWGFAGGLLAAGCLFKVSIGRYYVLLLLVASLCLGVTWYSISAPIDRLMNSVEDNIRSNQQKL